MQIRCGQVVGHKGQEKERQADSARVPANCDAPNDTSPPCKGAAAAGGSSTANTTRTTRLIHPQPHGGTSHLADTIFAMGCDVAAASDHVSRRVIIETMVPLRVPPKVQGLNQGTGP